MVNKVVYFHIFQGDAFRAGCKINIRMCNSVHMAILAEYKAFRPYGSAPGIKKAASVHFYIVVESALVQYGSSAFHEAAVSVFWSNVMISNVGINEIHAGYCH